MSIVVSVNVGQVRPLRHGGTTVPSAIRKQPVEGPVAVGPAGLAGDTQADRRHHGGPDKAVLLFSSDQYPTMARHIGGDLPIPSFGENLTISGTTERETCIGDRVRVGTALLEVTQPRNPCFKQAALHRVKDLVLEVERTGCTGWYARVLEPGTVSARDALTLLDRPHPDVTIAEIHRLIHPTADAGIDQERISAILTVGALGSSLRQRMQQLARNVVEDPSRRRHGPTA